MGRRFSLVGASGALVVMSLSGSARAESYQIGPGETLELTQDLSLSGADSLEATGNAQQPCTILGHGHTLRAQDGWSGHIVVQGCELKGLGSASVAAVAIRAAGDANILIEQNTFDSCGTVYIRTLEQAQIAFLGNTILESSVVPTVVALSDSAPAIIFEGYGNTTLKRFQGNRVYRSWVEFNQMSNWLIGGETPELSNIIVGNRAGMFIRGDQIRMVGNYLRSAGPLEGWNQVKTFEANGSDLIVEHNIMRDGNWLVGDFVGGELRYNLISDSHDRPWVLLRSDGDAKVHHNVFMRNNPALTDKDGIQVLYPAMTPSTEFYNNTMHGGGPCVPRSGPAVIVSDGSFLRSLRGNAIVQFPGDADHPRAMVTGELDEPEDARPSRLGYTDYNLFFNPKAVPNDNYSLSVSGESERKDAGFALHDAPAGGAVDQQLDPRFTGPIPVGFAFDEEDIKAGRVSICAMLGYYRRIFTPLAGSPLIDTGDPADGPGADIGAIGAGTPRPDDLFGKLCADVAMPNLPKEAFTCPPSSSGSSGGESNGASGGAQGEPGGQGSGSAAGDEPRDNDLGPARDCACRAAGGGSTGSAPWTEPLMSLTCVAVIISRRRRERR